MANRHAIGVPTEVLVVPDRFGAELPVEAVAEALVRGLAASGLPARVSTLDDPTYITQMRGARAVITGIGRLDRASLVGTILSEVATGARQAGVPCHAVVGANVLDLFDLRILDLQLVVEADTSIAIEAAGAELGVAIQAESARGN